MNDKLVSIVVPVYNSERYLVECVNSIVNQSYKKLEIILVNDGSTDNSLEICREFEKADVRITIIHQNNNGPGSARNTGIKNITGEYVTFVDSDDIINEFLIESHMNKIRKSNGNLSICGIDILNNGKIKESINFSKNMNLDQDVVKIKDYLKILLIEKANVYFGSNNNKLYNSYIIKNNRLLFNENTIFAEDFEFNIDYLMHIKEIVIIPNNLYYYRQDNYDSISKYPKQPILYWDRLLEIWLKYKIVMSENAMDETEKNAFLIYAVSIYFIREMYTSKRISIFQKKKAVTTVFDNLETNKIIGQAKGHSFFEKTIAFLINNQNKRLMVLVLLIRHFGKCIKIRSFSL